MSTNRTAGTGSRRGAAAVLLAASAVIAGATAGPAQAAGPWSTPVVLGQVDGTSAMRLVSAGDAAGDATVVWTTGGRVTASTRTASASWSRAATLSPAAETASSPAVAVRPDGTFVAVWAARRSADAVVEASLRAPGGAWSAPVVISAPSLPSVGGVQVAVDAAGSALVVWGQTTAPSAPSVAAAGLPVGGAWSAPVTLATPTGTAIRQVSLAVNAAGAAVVGWTRTAGDIYADVITRPAGGTFGAPTTLGMGALRPLQDQLHQLLVSIDPAGRAAAAFDTVRTSVTAQRADGTWDAPAAFPFTSLVSNLALGLEDTGTARLLWYDSGRILESGLAAGQGWSPPVAVLAGSSPSDLTIVPSGARDVAGWYDTGTNAVTAAVHTAAGWGAPATVGRLGASPWIAAVSGAPLGSGALLAWISGGTGPGTVTVSQSTF